MKLDRMHSSKRTRPLAGVSRLCVAMLAGAALLAPSIASANWSCAGRGDSGGPQLKVIGLTEDQWLVRFKECRPERLKRIGQVYGLSGDDKALVGIDFRVQDGKLYGVGNGGGVYTIDPETAMATMVSKLTVPLAGNAFGVDFNPAADRLRIVSDTGQNLRHNVNAGGVTLTDGALNYTPGTAASGITGAAYTNNDLDPNTATTLFDLDSALNQTVIQSPPNNGSLVATGKLKVDPDSPIGFDIYTALDEGVAIGNRGFASLMVGGESGFYRVNLLTGEATKVGEFGDRIKVVDIAVPLDQ